jgi:hypothetical protein
MFINQVINQKIAINCKTKEEAQRITKLAHEANCGWLFSDPDKVYWNHQEDTCYRLSSRMTHANKTHFKGENFEVVESTEISDDVWVKECDQEGLYWVTRDFKDVFSVYLPKAILGDYWYLPIPNSKRPSFRKPVDISFSNFKNKLYTQDGLPIDVNHYVCYDSRTQVVDVNGKVFDGPFYE